VQDTDIGVLRAHYEHAVAVLIGKPPADFGLRPAPLSLGPPIIPVGIPSQLLERRPYITSVVCLQNTGGGVHGGACKRAKGGFILLTLPIFYVSPLLPI